MLIKTIPLKEPTEHEEYSGNLNLAGKLYRRGSGLIYKLLPFWPSFHPYNLTICHEKKFIWYRVDKVCTRTTLKVLTESNINLDIEHAYNLYYPKNLYKDYFTFAFVRNPYDRLVSGWINKTFNSDYFERRAPQLAGFEKFEDFVDELIKIEKKQDLDSHFKAQHKLIDLNRVDFIGRYENFDQDFSYVKSKLGIPNNSVPKENESKARKKYQSYYSDEVKDKVTKLYQKDISLFMYEF